MFQAKGEIIAGTDMNSSKAELEYHPSEGHIQTVRFGSSYSFGEIWAAQFAFLASRNAEWIPSRNVTRRVDRFISG
jgi:hypothetical protein